MGPRVWSINGRFLAAKPSGVQRVAAELMKACDALLAKAEERPRSWTLLKPQDADRDLGLRAIDSRIVGGGRWQVWEQLALPWAARSSWLLNLCNTAPALFGANVVMMHDAQVFTAPSSYGRAMRVWYRILQPWLGRTAKHVLTVSEFSRSQLIALGVARPERISVVPNGVDHFASITSDPAAAMRHSQRPFVVGLANAQPHKNVAILLEAFRRPRLDGFDLILVGSASASDFSSSALPNVIFEGPVSDAQLKGLLEQAHCLAFPSLTEGFGLPPLEAMSVGCPALVAPCGALPETCGDAAVYVNPRDPDAWAEAIADLSEAPERRAAIIRAGRARAAMFTWRASAGRLLEILSRL